MIAKRPEFLVFGKPNFGEAEINAVARVMKSGWIGMGNECLVFEEELKEAIQAEEVITVSSCTAALHLSLLALGVRDGDEVIVPSLTWCATANAALYVGATPVLCDVDDRSLCITTEHVLAKLSSRTRAVIPVHFGGRAVDVHALRAHLPNDVSIVEDAAHAFGACYPNGKPVGSSGNLVCFSFYANKNLSTAEGGAIAAGDKRAADHLRSLRQSGLPVDAWKRYVDREKPISSSVSELGYKYNFTDLQAAIGRVQLRRQSEFATARLNIVQHYTSRLEPQGVQFQLGIANADHARHLAVAILPSSQLTRDEILVELRSRNIGASVHYQPLHRSRLYQTEASAVPITEALASKILTLPISASMDEGDAEFVAENLIEILRSG